MRNEGREPASLLVLAVGLSTMGTPRLDPAYPQGQSTTYAGQHLPSWWARVQEHSDGQALVNSLVGNAMTRLPSNGGDLSVVRATLAPGSVVSVGGATGLCVFTVNDGSVELSTDDRDLDDARVFRQLDVGEGTLLDQGVVASLRNVESKPIVITIVAILPAEA